MALTPFYGKAALKLEPIKRDKRAQQQRQAELKEQAIQRQKVKVAWGKYYEPLYNCKYPDSDKEFVWCQNYLMREKQKFKKLVAEGK